MSIIRNAVIIAVLVVLLLPVWFMLSGSFQPLKFIMVMPPRLIPWDLTLDNYTQLLEGIPIWLWIRNTLIVSIGIASTALILSVTAGYGFSAYRFKGRKIAMLFLLSLIMIPGQLLVIPIFVMLRKVGLSNTFFAGIAPRSLTVMGKFLMKNYMDRIPKSVIESGRIDGARELRILGKLILPQCKPVIGVIALFYSMIGVQDFLWQLLTMRKNKTFIVGLIIHLRQLEITYNSVGMALAVGTLVFVPLFLIYLSTNRLFIHGLTMAGMRE